MASAKQAKEWRAKGLCKDCGRKPVKDRVRCQPCLGRQAVYNKRAYDKRKGVAVEPQCQPSTGPMRAEHEWDDELGLCVRCGAKRPAGFVATAAPEPMPEITPAAPKPSAADSLKRSPGPRGTVAPLSREQKQRFHAGVMLPAPDPLAEVRKQVAQESREFAREFAARVAAEPVVKHPDQFAEKAGMPAEDVATFPDPIAATIAQLELELVETELVLDVLRRIHTRRKSA
jgi:hypothetical protein